MKKSFIFCTTLVCLVCGMVLAHAFGGAFCEGYQAGYKHGYCYRQSFGCIPPIPPMCPMPNMGENSYQDGYDRGFLDGLNEQ